MIPPAATLRSLSSPSSLGLASLTPACSSPQVHLLARTYGARVHLDGARLMNAAVALHMPPARIVEHCDSVSFCFSKVGTPWTPWEAELGLWAPGATAAAPPQPNAMNGAARVSPLPQGLGAPLGALIGGPKDFIEEAWRFRKALGGGMHQSGVLAAAALVGLADAKEILLQDHGNAQRFAKGAALPSPLLPFAPGLAPGGVGDSFTTGPRSPQVHSPEGC